jgi:hypothetical protein
VVGFEGGLGVVKGGGEGRWCGCGEGLVSLVVGVWWRCGECDAVSQSAPLSKDGMPGKVWCGLR